MSRRDTAWLADILAAIDAIDSYLAEGDLSQGVVYDACRARLIEIGEAVKHLDSKLLHHAPDIHWRAIARMRDQLAHHYFDTDHAIVTQAVSEQLPYLRGAVTSLIADVDYQPDQPDQPAP